MKEYIKIERNKTKREIFAIRFQQECSRLNKSVNQIERELGYPRNALHNYKSGAIPSGCRLLEIAKYFKVSPQYLIGEANESSDEDMKEFFQNLSFKDKKKLCMICQEWLISPIMKEVN